MSEHQDDPLWYDRVEADAPPGPVLHLVAWLFVAGRAVYRLPGALLDLCAQRLAGRTVAARRDPADV